MHSDLLGDPVEVGPIAGLELGMEELAIGPNFECSAASRNQCVALARDSLS